MSQPVQRQPLPPMEGIVKQAFRVNPEQFDKWIAKVKSFLSLQISKMGEGIDLSREEVEKIANTSILALTPLISEGGIVIQGNDPDAFKSEARRKLILLASIVYDLVQVKAGECSEMLHLLSKTGLDKHVDKTTMKKAIDKCITALNEGFLSPLVLAVGMDTLSGVLQANLPAGIMPNTLTVWLGYLKD